MRNFINNLHTHESRKTFERNNAVQDVMLFSPPPPLKGVNHVCLVRSRFTHLFIEVEE